ncbi:MAG: hypothetical protein ACOZNI_15985 [Myxococcota bacterium]
MTCWIISGGGTDDEKENSWMPALVIEWVWVYSVPDGKGCVFSVTSQAVPVTAATSTTRCGTPRSWATPPLSEMDEEALIETVSLSDQLAVPSTFQFDALLVKSLT